jgi:tetratricopeptide (TPR) repeat protein
VRVCVLAAMRPVEEEDPLLAELLADPATTVERPNALTMPAVTELVRAELGAEAEQPFCLACHHATGGNPLLLRELLRTLASDGVAPAASSIGVVERVAPDAVARSVRLRLSRQVASQLLAAPPESVEGAVAILRDAASAAAGEGGLESAVRYLRRALEEPLPGGERGELLLELGGAESSLGAPTVVAHLEESVSLLRDPGRRAEASLALGHALYWAGHEEDGVEVLERALAGEPDLDAGLRHRLEAELIVNATRLPSQYKRARARLARIDVSVDEGPGARVLLSGRAYHEGVGGGNAERAAATALAALTAMSDEERARNYTAGCYVLLHTDRLDEGVRLLDATLADVRRRGAVFHFSSLSMTRAIFQYARGALAEAEADGRAALEALPRQNVWFVPAAHGWLAQILVERGAAGEAAVLLEAAEATVAPDAFSRAPLLRARTMVEAARGDFVRPMHLHTYVTELALAAEPKQVPTVFRYD